MATKRIEYIDAMRGFTIFLVVLGHVSTFDLGLYGTDTFSYSLIFKEFRMPLFFFISGFVLYKKGFEWSFANSFQFLKKKLSVQILSPFLFFFASIATRQLSFIDSLFDYQKAGYWFTTTLFEFFVFYIILQWVSKFLQLKKYLIDLFLLTFGGGIYIATIFSIVQKFHLDTGYASLIGVPTWNNFIFFVIGSRVRKKFHIFQDLINNKYFVMIAVCLFILLNLYPHTKIVSNTLWNFMTASTGIVVIFTFFHKYKDTFDTNHRVGRWMQHIGRRTLDIYLIHYFFVFSNMHAFIPNFSQLHSPFIEFVCSSFISIIIIGCCLVVSSVLRLSPIMAHFLFGKKI